MGAVIVLMVGMFMYMVAVIMRIMAMVFVWVPGLFASSQRRVAGSTMHAVRLGVDLFSGVAHVPIIVPPFIPAS